MNLVTRLLDQANTRGEQAALVQGDGQSIGFAALADRSARVAAMLRASGLTPGQRVLVLAPMSIDLYALLTAVWRLGAVAVMVDPGAGLAHARRALARAQPTALIGVRRAHLLRWLVPELRRVKRSWCIDGWAPASRRYARWRTFDADPAVAPVRLDDPALLTFTSGSTGEPKAAVRTHGFLVRQHEAIERSIGLAPGQIDLATLPVFALANLASGVTTVIPDADLRRVGAVDPERVWRQMERRRPTRCTASPAFFEQLLKLGREMPWFERVCTGGAPTSVSLLDRLAEACPSAKVTAVYGSTEAEPIAETPAAAIGRAERRVVSTGGGLPAGRPIPEIELRIIEDRNGQPIGPLDRHAFEGLTLSRGQAGEIVVTGPHVLRGYLNGRGDGETKIHIDGSVWHRTGDAGRLDEHGRLWLLGRAAAKVVDARGTLYPLAVEAAADDLVDRCALVSHRGARTLVVEAGDTRNAGREDLEARLRERLAWAALDRILFTNRVPVDRRHNAKIDYPHLHRWLAKQR